MHTEKKTTSSFQFEQEYNRLRVKEKRNYSDEEVKQLPYISKDHPHFTEWKLRAQSCERLINYLSKKQMVLQVLEIGCGNGWLSHRLSGVKNIKVTGTDINTKEIEQAKKIFKTIPNLHFENTDVFANPRPDKFDIIVFAASLQYFSSLSDTLCHALSFLKPAGEIHIIDIHFYSPEGRIAATKRSNEYFDSLGFPGMSEYYHHHRLDELNAFDPESLYSPSAISSFFQINKNPFSWFRIKKGTVS